MLFLHRFVNKQQVGLHTLIDKAITKPETRSVYIIIYLHICIFIQKFALSCIHCSPIGVRPLFKPAIDTLYLALKMPAAAAISAVGDAGHSSNLAFFSII